MPNAPEDQNGQQAPRKEQRLDWLASPDADFRWDDDSKTQPPKPKSILLRRLAERQAQTQPPINAPAAITTPGADQPAAPAQDMVASEATPTYVGEQFIAPSIADGNLQSPARKRVRLSSPPADGAEQQIAPAPEEAPNLQSTIYNPQPEELPPPPTAGRRLIQTREGWILLALIIIAAILRFNGLLYDNNGNGQPQLNHPDERFITMVTSRPHWDPGTPLSALFDADNSPITTRPGWQDYTYGSLPIYITKIAGEIATRVTGKPWWDYEHIVLVGRFMSGVMDIGTLLLVFLIARRLYSTRAGLFAAAIICFSVLNIQLAHFYATDSFVTFFFMLTIYFALRYIQEGTWGAAIGMGAGLGFAVASKFTIVPLALVIFVAFALRAIYVQRPQLLGAAFERRTIRPFAANPAESPWAAFGRMILKLIASLVTTLLAFEIGEPYALFRLPQYLGKIGEQNNIMKGLADVPYTRQYIGTMPVIYQLGNLALWGLGIVMGAVVIAGLFFIFFRFLFDLPGLIGLTRGEGRRFGRMSGGQRSGYLLTRLLGAALIIAVMAALVGVSKPLLLQAGVFNEQSTGLLSNGYIVGALAGVGLIVFFALLASLRFTRPGEALLFSAALPYTALIFSLEAKWARYMLPLVPIFAIFTAGALWTAYRWAKRRQAARALREPARARIFTLANGVRLVGVIAIVGGILWAAAFEVGVYGSPPTFLQTSQWVAKNIPPNAVIGTESWDEGIPGVNTGVTLQIYDSDRPGDVAFQAFNTWMNGGNDPIFNKDYPQGADYIVIASNRLYMTVPKLPWRYPVATRYYDLLFNGQLGYEKVFEATRYPSLFGITVNDDHADETFTVYDHPKVMIFKKVRNLSQDELRTLFGNALTQPVIGGRVNKLNVNNPAPGEKPVTADKTIMLDQPVGSLPVVQDYAWNSFASNNQWVAVALWLIVVYLLSFITLPLTWGLFRWLPDRGYAFSKVLTLVLVAFFAWLMSSLHIAMFDVWAILVAVAIVALMSGYFWVRQRHELLAWLRSHARLVLAIEVVFLLAYFFQLWLRTFNPDLWGPAYGGERPMEFAFLNGVLRSPYMPPQDPFFAGGTINYYYYGYVLLAVLIKLTGIIPTLAFNLSMALIFALAFSVIASVVYNTVVFAQQRNRRRDSSVDYPTFSATGLRYGILGGTLAMLVSNVFGGLQAIFTLNPSLYNWASEQLVKTGFATYPLGEGIQHGFNFWTTSRIIPGTITEFPFWSFLYGDLHPHMISIPVQVLTLGFALNFAFDRGMTARWRRVATNTRTVQDSVANFFSRTGAQWSDSFAVGALRFLALTITVGSLAVINSWDFPTALAVILGGLLIPLLIRERVNGRLRALISYPSAWLGTGLLFGAIAGAALTLYLPFYINFKVLYSKIAFIIPGQPVVPGGDFTFQRTQLSEYLVIWGLFILIAIAYLLLRLRGVRFLPEGAEAYSLRPSVVSGFVAGGFGGNGSRDDQDDRRNSNPETGSSGRQSGINPAPTEDDLAAQALTQHSALSTQHSAAPVRGTVRARASEVQPVLSASVPPMTVAAPTDGASAAEHEATSSNTIIPVGAQFIAPSADPLADPNPQSRIYNLPSEPVGAQFIAPSADPFTDPNLQSTIYNLQSANVGAQFIAPPAIPAELTKTQVVTQHPSRITQHSISGAGLSVALPSFLPLLLFGATVALAVFVLPAKGELLLGFLSLLIGMALVVTFGRRNDRAGLATSLFLLVALGITTGTELVYLADHLQGGDMYRMNTVFKFYEQAWIYFSLAGAMGLFYIFDGRDEVLVARRAEGAARAVAEDVSTGKPITMPATDASIPTTPTHPFIISEWRQNGIDGYPDAAPYSAPYTITRSGNGSGPNDGEFIANEWGQTGSIEYGLALDAASSDGYEAGDAALITSQAQPGGAVKRPITGPLPTDANTWVSPLIAMSAAGRITGPLPTDANTGRPTGDLVTNEWGPPGSSEHGLAPDTAFAANQAQPSSGVKRRVTGPLPTDASTGRPTGKLFAANQAQPGGTVKRRITGPLPPNPGRPTGKLVTDEWGPPGNEPADEPANTNDYAPDNDGGEPIVPRSNAGDDSPLAGWYYKNARAASAAEATAYQPAAHEPVMTYPETRAEQAMAEQGMEITPSASAEVEKEAVIAPLPTPHSSLRTPRSEARGWWAEQFHPPVGGASTIFRVVFTPLFLILLLLSLGFNVYGTRDRLTQRFDQNPPLGTLDGIDWMKTASIPYKSGTIVFSYEYDGIKWLLNHVNGTPVVAQAPENYYREAGDFVAVFTGFPTIIGPQHEGEQRYAWQVDEHNRDADALFNPSTDVAATQLLMSKYDVQYIYVGQVERLKYNMANGQPNKFDDMVAAKSLQKVYSNDRVAIYHVVGKPQQQAGTDLKAGPRPTPTPRPTATPVPPGFDTKLDELRKKVADNPNDEAAHLDLASYLREKGDKDGAVAEYRAAVKIKPDDVAAWQQMGDVLNEEGRTDDAIAAWKSATDNAPNSPDAWNKLGIAYRDQKQDYDSAAAAFHKAIDASSGFGEAYYNLGLTLEKKGDIQGAKAAYQDGVNKADNPDWKKRCQDRLNALQ